MNKKIALGVAVLGCGLMSFSAFADSVTDDGASPYFGVQFGGTDSSYTGTSYIEAKKGRNTYDNENYAGRAYLGYNFDKYLGLEAGYGYYGKVEIKQPINGLTQDLRQEGIDFSGKIRVPLFYNLGLYAKAGFVWMYFDALDSKQGNFASEPNHNFLDIIAAAGLSYSFTQKISADVSWNKIFEMSNSPRITFYALGLTYTFR